MKLAGKLFLYAVVKFKNYIDRAKNIAIKITLKYLVFVNTINIKL
jgi:hypothetical protein